MDISLIDKLVFIILFAHLHGLGHDNYNDVSTETIPSEHYNHRLSTADVSESNATDRGSFNIIFRMIAIGFRRSDKNENSELHRPINSGYVEDKSTLQPPTSDRLALLPLMISTLLERMKQHAASNPVFEDLQKSSQMTDESDAEEQSDNKQHTFYNTLKELTKTNVDEAKAEKVTLLLFSLLSCLILVITIFLVIRRLQYFNKYGIVQVSSAASPSQKNHEEIVKLLP